ncbi:hypothetical protein [Streptomyces peucetius]|uniref:Uncharacterized protein n=1 Tax=Streptomyces peucetius TaxID=1950 RepID=A0ABY6I5V5_STRPE|nr:hypothetical protein [Streptomyces peucetius]UYQ62373.1 hypothetical protein OGH68_13370 [Streptomyces peucetius]
MTGDAHHRGSRFTLQVGRKERRGELAVLHWQGTSQEFGDIQVR